MEFQFLCTGTNNTLLNILNQSNYYHIKTRAYICMHVCVYVCMYVWVHMCICVCGYINRGVRVLYSPYILRSHGTYNIFYS